MKAKNLLLIAVAVLSLAGCKYDDDALWDAVNKQEERIAALETWQKQASQEIAALKAITDESDYILSMDSIMDGTTRIGYTITFKKSGTITLMNGQKGDTPLISLQKGEDGNYYWTLNGDLMTDANGAPIRANGAEGAEGAPAPTPQLKTGSQLKALSIPGTWQTDAFYLSVDGGKTWNKVSGDKGDKGDKGDTGATGAPGAPGSSGSGGGGLKVDIDSDPTLVTFTLADGTTTFTVPRYNVELVIEKNGKKLEKGENVNMGFDSEATFTYSQLAPGSTIVVIPPAGWTANQDTDKSTITIHSPTEEECRNKPGLAGPVKTVIMVSGGNGLNAIYTIQTTASSMDKLTCTAEDLIEMLDQYPKVKTLKVSGALTAEHMTKINSLFATLQEIDLEDATLADGIPDEQFQHFVSLTTVKLPEGLTKIGSFAFNGCIKLTTVSNIEDAEEIGETAFKNCTALRSITIGCNLPDNIFENCTSLEEIVIQGSVKTKTIGMSAFRGCESLTTITIPEGVETIGILAFTNCTSLTTITFPTSLTKVGYKIFTGSEALKSITCLNPTPPKCTGSSLGINMKMNPLPDIYVPEGFAGVYKSDSFWKQYEKMIKAIP